MCRTDCERAFSYKEASGLCGGLRAGDLFDRLVYFHLPRWFVANAVFLYMQAMSLPPLSNGFLISLPSRQASGVLVSNVYIPDGNAASC